MIEGLSPPPGTISTSSYAGMDGSYLNNAFIEKRNVVIHTNAFLGGICKLKSTEWTLRQTA